MRRLVAMLCILAACEGGAAKIARLKAEEAAICDAYLAADRETAIVEKSIRDGALTYMREHPQDVDAFRAAGEDAGAAADVMLRRGDGESWWRTALAEERDTFWVRRARTDSLKVGCERARVRYREYLLEID